MAAGALASPFGDTATASSQGFVEATHSIVSWFGYGG